MALRLSGMVLAGEINNTRKNTVCGWLVLRDRERPVPLQLTGNCEADLAGRHIRFAARGEAVVAEELDLSELATQQVGPTGTMTAARTARIYDCTPQEYQRRVELGEPPPATIKPCLYLEWFSQNGRVIVELVDPLIEFIEDEDLALDQDDDPPQGEYLKYIYDGEELASENLDALFADDSLAGEEDEDDPYDLFPAGLDDQLHWQATQADEAFEADEELPQVIRDLELINTLLERDRDVPVSSLFDPPMRLPSVAKLGVMSDEQAESVLKSLLARLAQHGIALDMCEHFTPRDAYRLLVEYICPEEGCFPELRQTQWVQHFMTHEFCPECEAAYHRKREEPPFF